MKTRKGTAAAAADDGQGQEDDDGREDSRDAGNGEDTIRQGMHAGPKRHYCYFVSFPYCYHSFLVTETE